MKLDIQPYLGVGPIRFGMTIDEVRKVINRQPKPFLKGPNSIIPTDAFGELGIHVYYKKQGTCKAVEMGSPANPTFEGHSFIGQPFDKVLTWFRIHDDAIKVDDVGFSSLKLGIGIYAPYKVEIEGVIVFEEDYYSKKGQ